MGSQAGKRKKQQGGRNERLGGRKCCKKQHVLNREPSSRERIVWKKRNRRRRHCNWRGRKQETSLIKRVSPPWVGAPKIVQKRSIRSVMEDILGGSARSFHKKKEESRVVNKKERAASRRGQSLGKVRVRIGQGADRIKEIAGGKRFL